jgi:hypothetical protein
MTSEYRYEHSPKGREAKRRQRKNYRAKHVKEFKAQRRKDNSTWKAKQHEILHDYKRTHPCACGESEIACLDFHHINPAEKDFHMTKVGSVSSARIQAEILKCVVLCANCHRKGHAGRPMSFHAHLFT